MHDLTVSDTYHAQKLSDTPRSVSQEYLGIKFDN